MLELEDNREEQKLESDKNSKPVLKNTIRILIRVFWVLACVVIHKTIAYQTIWFLLMAISDVSPYLGFVSFLIYIGVPILIGNPIMRRKSQLKFFIWSFIITDIVFVYYVLLLFWFS